MRKSLLLILALLLSGSCQAAGIETYDDWKVMNADGNGLAFTTEQGSDLALAFRCLAGSRQCMHLLVAGIQCREGHRYPILINTDGGAETTEGICALNRKSRRHELYFTGFDQIHRILQENRVIGFAIPMQSGAFKAVRFSLKGSAAAMKRVKAIVLHPPEKKQRHEEAPPNGASYF